MPGRRPTHRADLTSRALIAEAKRLGARYLAHDGTIDGTLWLPDGRLVLCDWKTPGADLTPAQGRLVAAGWSITFISEPRQLQTLIGVAVTPEP